MRSGHWRRFWSWLQAIVWRSRADEDLDEELEFHLEKETLGAPRLLIREQCWDARGLTVIDDFIRDLKHAFRLLARSPQFTVIVLLTLAIAIGATVTVFSIVDAWLVRPLSFPQASRLAIAFAARPERPDEPAVWLPYRTYLGLKDRNRAFTSVSGAFVRDVTVTTATNAQTMLGLMVTPDFFGTFAVPPLLGRSVSQDDDTADRVVVLSYGLWQRFFGGSPAAIGTSVTMSGVPHRIIGVMPRDFDVRVLDMRFEFWVPLRRDEPAYGPGGLGPVAIVGRMRDGATLEGARSEIATISRDIESQYQPNFNRFVVNLSSLQSDNTRVVRATLLTVLAAVACVLLITCTNVGTLLLGRGLARSREIAVRTALGCGKRRLVRQLLTESFLLAFLGTAAGLAIAMVAVRLFVAWNPLGYLPASGIALNLRTLAAAALAMGATTVLAGLVPTWRIAAAAPNDALRAGGDRGSAAPAQRTQTIMLAVQMATCLVLLVAAALMIRTFSRLQDEPLGFDPRDLSVGNVILPKDAFDSSEKRNSFYRQLADRLRGHPGIVAVGASTSPPLSSGAPVTAYTGTGDPTTAPRISAQEVSAGFFETMGIRLVAGRTFSESDGASGLPVLVMNARAAQDLFGGAASAVGRRVRLNDEGWRQVIGVVSNVRSSFFNTLEWRVDPILYRPAQQGFATLSNPTATTFGFFLHVRADRPFTMSDLRGVAAAVNQQAAVTELRPVPDIVREATRQPAFRMTLLFGFAVLGVLLVAIGTFGLVSQMVTQRRRELAIRLALGARRTMLVKGVVWRALAIAIAGVLAGAAAALAAGRILQALVYGVRPSDPWSLAIASVTLLGATLAASLIPALRIVAIDPATVLHSE
jgi:putative ABC transport system permease protein